MAVHQDFRTVTGRNPGWRVLGYLGQPPENPEPGYPGSPTIPQGKCQGKQFSPVPETPKRPGWARNYPRHRGEFPRVKRAWA